MKRLQIVDDRFAVGGVGLAAIAHAVAENGLLRACKEPVERRLVPDEAGGFELLGTGALEVIIRRSPSLSPLTLLLYSVGLKSGGTP
jgi:hypothetical protein